MVRAASVDKRHGSIGCWLSPEVLDVVEVPDELRELYRHTFANLSAQGLWVVEALAVALAAAGDAEQGGWAVAIGGVVDRPVCAVLKGE